jgi:hypothetical protein
MAKIDTSLVADLPLFAGLATADLDAILSEAKSIRVTKNSPVFEQGEDAHSFFVLLHGHVRATKTTPAGEQIVVRYVATGETFGVAKAIGLQRYPATATAVDDSVVLAWRPEHGPAWSRNSRRSPPTRCRPSAPASRKPTPVSWRCRPSRLNSASPTHSCGWSSNPDAR